MTSKVWGFGWDGMWEFKPSCPGTKILWSRPPMVLRYPYRGVIRFFYN
jgi:hypothetical protein